MSRIQGDIDELLLDVDQQAKNETENETENESLKDKLKHLEAEKLRLQQQLAKQEEDLQSTRSQISTSVKESEVDSEKFI